jgi:hypothetical protein
MGFAHGSHLNLWWILGPITGDEKLAQDKKDMVKVKAFRMREAQCRAELVLRVDKERSAS